MAEDEYENPLKKYYADYDKYTEYAVNVTEDVDIVKKEELKSQPINRRNIFKELISNIDIDLSVLMILFISFMLFSLINLTIFLKVFNFSSAPALICSLCLSLISVFILLIFEDYWL